ncbi:hypothetical protein X975_21916, partial [Stegodyphus mimosarum]
MVNSMANTEKTGNQSDGAIPFWIDKPEIWFYQIEIKFKINGISNEDTKFNYIVSEMEPKYVDTIWDIITGKTENKYSLAKERLLTIFKVNENKRIKRFFTGTEIGKMRPCHLLGKKKRNLWQLVIFLT